MKKVILLVGCLSLLIVGIVTSSCKKDDKKEFKGCTCTVRDDDGERNSFTVSAAEMKEEGFSSCSQLQRELREGWDYASCSEL